MGLSILIYVVLDGFDLGVGLLFPAGRRGRTRCDDELDRSLLGCERNWLVLAIGLLLVAFPVAHGTILTALYLRVALMLFGLILRGVAFEFATRRRLDRNGMGAWPFSAEACWRGFAGLHAWPLHHGAGGHAGNAGLRSGDGGVFWRWATALSGRPG